MAIAIALLNVELCLKVKDLSSANCNGGKCAAATLVNHPTRNLRQTDTWILTSRHEWS